MAQRLSEGTGSFREYDLGQNQIGQLDSQGSISMNAIEAFNDNQKDTRVRATQICYYSFIIAGVALTTSISIFMSRPKGQIGQGAVYLLRTGWNRLFISIICFLILLVAMILRDYLLAELDWRPQLGGKPSLLPGKRHTYFVRISDVIIILFGLTGVWCLCNCLHRVMMAAILTLT